MCALRPCVHFLSVICLSPRHLLYSATIALVSTRRTISWKQRLSITWPLLSWGTHSLEISRSSSRVLGILQQAREYACAKVWACNLDTEYVTKKECIALAVCVCVCVCVRIHYVCRMVAMVHTWAHCNFNGFQRLCTSSDIRFLCDSFLKRVLCMWMWYKCIQYNWTLFIHVDRCDFTDVCVFVRLRRHTHTHAHTHTHTHRQI
jgi:hypothetical protein